jgi:AP-2 complex subunit alpha
MLRLTVRATEDTLPPLMLKMMVERLAMGVSVRPEQYEPPTASEISDTFRNVMVQ